MFKPKYNDKKFNERKHIMDENEKGIFQNMIFNQMRIHKKQEENKRE